MARSTALRDAVGAVTGAVQIVLEMQKLETCLDRLESKKQFLDTAGVTVSVVDSVNSTIASVFTSGKDPILTPPGARSSSEHPTMDLYNEHIMTYYRLASKYGNIIDRDISTIKASAAKIQNYDQSNS